MYGSGYFAVHLNDSTLAEVSEKDGIVTLTPLREGSLEVRIEDVEIPDS
jgi:hypothetical protein